MNKTVSLLFAAFAAAIVSADPVADVNVILAEAATLASNGEWQAAAETAARGVGVADAPAGLRAMAVNASLNYFAMTKKQPAEDNRRIRLNSLFSDHAVIQRGMPVPVWGHVAPNKFVTIGLGGIWLSAKANEFGYFKVIFPKMDAGGPYTLEAYCDGDSYKAEDIYVGEVWVAGGQSNMEMPLTGYGDPVSKEDYAALESKQPVRMFKVPQCDDTAIHEDCGSKWMTTWKGNEKIWSATASFFAYNVANKLDCPVGIVLCAYSGTRAEAWLSFDAMNSLKKGHDLFEKYEYDERQLSVVDDNKPFFSAKYGITAPQYSGIMKDVVNNHQELDLNQPPEGRERPDFDDSDWKKVVVPENWYKTLGKANGVAWFRKTVEIPAAWAGKELVLSLGAADKQDKTFFNGVFVGETGKEWEHKYWGTERVYKVPADAVKAGKAVIAVRVFSMADRGGLVGPAEVMKLSCGEESIPLAGDDWAAKLTVDIGERGGYWRAYRWQPHYMADNMLTTIVPYAARGVIWYQGCGNSGRTDYDYRELMETLIQDWRNRWNRPDMPFIQVLLAGYDRPGFEDVRQAQRDAAKTTGTWFASAIDGGHQNIHPPYKKELGERLALRACKDVYKLAGATGEYPEFSGLKVDNGIVIVSFANAEDLHAKSGVIGGFEVAEEDNFVAARAELDGETVKVVIPGEIKNPKWIRYAWKPFPVEANLYNAANLPALPFKAELK